MVRTVVVNLIRILKVRNTVLALLISSVILFALGLDFSQKVLEAVMLSLNLILIIICAIRALLVGRVLALMLNELDVIL